jgi:hypothetical protein
VTTTLGKYEYKSRVEFGLTSRRYFGRNNALAFCWVEVCNISAMKLV